MIDASFFIHSSTSSYWYYDDSVPSKRYVGGPIEITIAITVGPTVVIAVQIIAVQILGLIKRRPPLNIDGIIF